MKHLDRVTRLINMLGAHKRLREAEARGANDDLIKGLNTHLQYCAAELTSNDLARINKAAILAHKAATGEVKSWESFRKPKTL